MPVPPPEEMPEYGISLDPLSAYLMSTGKSTALLVGEDGQLRAAPPDPDVTWSDVDVASGGEEESKSEKRETKKKSKKKKKGKRRRPAAGRAPLPRDSAEHISSMIMGGETPGHGGGPPPPPPSKQ